MRLAPLLRTVALAIWAGLPSESAVAQVVVTGSRSLAGTVEAVVPGGISLRDADGTLHEVLIQAGDEPGVPLSDGRLLAAPVEARVVAEFSASGLKPGQIVRFRCRLDQAGRAEAPVAELTVVEGSEPALGVVREPAAEQAFADCEVSGRVKLARGRRLVVELPRDKAFGGKSVLSIPLAEDALARLESGDPARIEPGGRVVRLEAIALAGGELVARAIDVENPAAASVADRGDEALERKYRGLSAEPPDRPRLVRSRHFAFVTDLSDREWAVVQDKLERMVLALEGFLGRRLAGVVEGFVARDLSRFPPGLIDDEQGIEKIRRGEGVCMNSRRGPRRQARLYACADHGVIQHECVHGLCHLTFGSTGPAWLAEGLAELGNYWQEGERSVDLPVGVMAYLQNASPRRTLLEIATPGRPPDATWQDYAWRWALCHLLANNPNYSDRFVPLAIALMEEREGVSFESVYGPVAREIAFEYAQFLATVGNGYRSDLTAWPWQARFQPLGGAGDRTVTIAARRGWQASRVIVEEGVEYEIEAAGSWRLAKAGSAVDADGEADGRGRLVGAVLADFELSAEIPLGRKASFEPPRSGQLFLRCRDDWTALADNDGQLKVTIRRAR